MAHKNPELRIEPIACPACGAESDFFISSTDVNRKITSEIFEYFRCKACDLVFLNPIPEDLARFYRGGYNSIPSDLDELRAIAKREVYRMDPILRHKRSGSLLEIGPWMGIFSINAKDAGFDVTAIEIDERCVRFLKDVVGINAIQSSDPARIMAGMNKKFDVIALWHSLEHLNEPWKVLRSAAESLAPGGILLIALPDIESFDFADLKDRWTHLDAPRHLFFYTVRSLAETCLRNGLKEVELTTSDRLSDILSKIAWSHWANSVLPVRYVRHFLFLLRYWFARFRSKGHGSGLTAIFIKPESRDEMSSTTSVR